MTSKEQSLSTARSTPSRIRRAGGLVAVGSAGAIGLRAALKKRNASLHAAADALSDTVSAPGSHGDPLPPDPGDPTAHATGHRHMGPSPSQAAPQLSHRSWRRWAPRADHTSHPPRA